MLIILDGGALGKKDKSKLVNNNKSNFWSKIREVGMKKNQINIAN